MQPQQTNLNSFLCIPTDDTADALNVTAAIKKLCSPNLPANDVFMTQETANGICILPIGERIYVVNSNNHIVGRWLPEYPEEIVYLESTDLDICMSLELPVLTPETFADATII